MLDSKKVRLVALTATASRSSRESTVRSLRMHKPSLVYVPPMKKNIFYVVQPKVSIESLVCKLVAALREFRTSMPRIIIFCRRYDECFTMYHMLKSHLGNEFTEPRGAPDITKYCLVDMYTRCTEKAILNSFCSPGGRLRIVIGTIAIGMGIDCTDVQQTIHWRLSSDIESHVQETGRAGRDGFLSCSLLLHGGDDTRTASEQMVKYSKNSSVCRRKLRFEDFEDCE